MMLVSTLVLKARVHWGKDFDAVFLVNYIWKSFFNDCMMNLMLNPQYEEDLKGLFNQINRIEMHQEILINNIKEGIDRHNGN